MNFVGSEVLQTVHLCVWAREAEGNLLGTTTAHKTNFITGIIFLWQYILISSFSWAFQGQYERAGPIFNVSFLPKVFGFLWGYFFPLFVWIEFLLLLFIDWVGVLFCLHRLNQYTAVLSSFPHPLSDFPKCNEYLITLELNKLLNP